MAQLSRYVLEPLWDDGNFVLYRGTLGDEREPVLVLAAASERPPPWIIARLEHTYALREELEAAPVARPLRLVQHQGSPALLMEDPGGELLVGLFGRRRGLSQFLRVAINVAEALQRLHLRGIIHRDVKPANILVNLSTGEARLVGACFVSRLPRGQLTAPAEEIAATMAYMAPEQTGRVNRSVDARSDLYSFGVTLYEMFTGSLPFTATDPLEWIHCQIARQPTPPDKRVPEIPKPLSDIIMKLLSKTAEERYQTAAGLEADLQICLSAWETQGRIEPFPLGAQDLSDRPLIPEKLYGRDSEREMLLEAVDRVVAGGKTELALVSGDPGIGKSSVVNELHTVVALRGGIFISAKFDQQKRDIPYATLAQAFQSVVLQILSKSEEEVDHWRDAIRDAVGIDGQLMLNLLPELELVIGKQPPVPELPLEAVQNRVQMMWLRLLRVFARAKHILVLFLDDLQWLDRATLDLLNRLVNDPEVSYLLLIGAYRDNEVPPSHPLALTLERIRRSGAAVNQIVLEPLSIKDMERLVTDALDCGSERVGPFARLLHAKTGGNPFFAIQLLTALAEEGLLVFDRRSSAWTWDLLRIQAKRYADDVVELMSEKLKRLPHPTQWALKQLACLGSSAKISTLKLVYGQSEESIHAELWDAVRAGLVFSLDGMYAFLHDRVQEAAYSLIPEGERAATHLRIGRLLASSVTSDEIDEEIFEIVNQLNRARPLITSLEERERLAQLNFIAGKRAKTAEAYASALNYFAASESFLAEDSWVQDRRLAFDVSLNLAECEFRTGQLAEAETRLSLLSERAANRIEASAVVRLHAALCMTRGRFDQARDVCLEYLRRAGVELSQHPRQEDVEREYTKIWQQVGGRAIEELVDLPLASDPEYRATLDVLSELTAHAWYIDQNLHDLVVAHTANLSLEHGNSDASCYAYAVFGSVLGSTLGQYQVGFRFGQLGLDLVEKRGLDRFKARVYSCFGHHIVPWTRSLREGRAWIRRALDAAKETGDLPFVAFGCANLISNLFAGGNPLEEVEREAENALEFTRRIKFGLVTGRIKAQLSLVRTLRGLTPKFGCFSDADFDESQFEQYLESDPRLSVAAGRYWLRKLEARFYANDFATALAAAANVKLFFKRSQSFLDFAEYPFYAALAHAALSRPASSRTGRPLTVDEQVLQREEIASHHRRLAIWQENCPENFGSAATLVAAEIARIDGRELEAEHLYEEAIQLAQKYGLVQNEAIAQETAARFYSQRGLETIANTYLQNAHRSYLRWGALGKVKHLKHAHPDLLDPPRFAAEVAPASALGQVDVLALAKASQAVSSELDLRKLTETLLILALKNAGAERGVFIPLRDNGPEIEAEAVTGADAVTVDLRRASPSASDMPDSLVRYVIRSQESVIVDDASAQNAEVKLMRGLDVVGNFSCQSVEFLDDEYVRQRRPRSILCLPLVKQAELLGVLYLENNLAPGVFTTQRLVLLELLASQAAISFDHARLVAELKRENLERKRAEGELRGKEISLREAQTELAHVNRVTTMGELAASIAHEINQPLAGIVSNANASLRWLARESPDLVEASQAIQRILRDGNRAGEVIARMRALFKKARAAKERFDINAAIEEVVVLTKSEVQRNKVALRMELAPEIPNVMGDRVQLQQVVMNLMLNAVEAMRTVEDRRRELVIRTERSEGGQVRVAVEDSGVGLDPVSIGKIFDPFYSTKPGGLGMGLSISRSIVEGHQGRLWAVPNVGPGATFQFTL